MTLQEKLEVYREFTREARVVQASAAAAEARAHKAAADIGQIFSCDACSVHVGLMDGSLGVHLSLEYDHIFPQDLRGFVSTMQTVREYLEAEGIYCGEKGADDE